MIEQLWGQSRWLEGDFNLPVTSKLLCLPFSLRWSSKDPSKWVHGRTWNTWQRLPEAVGDVAACINQMQTHKTSHTHTHTGTHAIRVRSQKMSLDCVLVNITWASRHHHESPGTATATATATAPASCIDPFWHPQTIPKRRVRNRPDEARLGRPADRITTHQPGQGEVVLLNKVKCHQNQKENATYA